MAFVGAISELNTCLLWHLICGKIADWDAHKLAVFYIYN